MAGAAARRGDGIDGQVDPAAHHEAAAAGLESLGRAYRAWALEHPILYGLMFGGSLAGQFAAGEEPW